jgi:hypothetical protein
MSLDTLIETFENKNEYKLSEYIKEGVQMSNLIHLNQINDIKNQEFNHIAFIGNFNEALAQDFPQLKFTNTIIVDELNHVYVNEKLNIGTFKPNHTPYSFKCSFVKNLDDVFNGMIKIKDYYILLNTNNKNVELNVYAHTKGSTPNCDYIFMVLIGKVINPKPYTLEEVNNFKRNFKLNLSDNLTNYLTLAPKIFGLTVEDKNRLYTINLNGNSNLYENIQIKFNRKDFNNFDLEGYRKPLMNFWEKLILNEFSSEDQKAYDSLKEEITNSEKNFLNGFMKIGTIDNQKYLFSELNQDLILELYLLVNIPSELNSILEGTVWVYQLSDPGNCTNKDMNYLPIRKMQNIGKIYNFNKVLS